MSVVPFTLPICQSHGQSHDPVCPRCRYIRRSSEGSLPDIGAIDAHLIALRLTDAERNIYLGVADFTIAIQQAKDKAMCLHLQERLARLLLALGAVSDSATLKAMDYDAS